MSSEPSASGDKAIVLDANILVRAVLGRRVLVLLETYGSQVHFLTPELAYEEVRAHLPQILARRGAPPEAIRHLLEQEILPRLPMLVAPVPHEAYADLEPEARRRLRGRDEGDWPFLALALRLGCPIWTEDAVFFKGFFPALGYVRRHLAHPGEYYALIIFSVLAMNLNLKVYNWVVSMRPIASFAISPMISPLWRSDILLRGPSAAVPIFAVTVTTVEL